MQIVRHAQMASLALLAASTSVVAIPAQAQDEDFEQIVTIMRACAQIADIDARVTCYDNNIQPRQSRAQSPNPAEADGNPRPLIASAPRAAPAADSPQEFGRETLQQTHVEQRAERADELEAHVVASRRVAPGIYELELPDGALWRLVDSAPSSYDPPYAGSQVRIERGSLGSFFLHYAGQRSLRIRRVE